MEPGSTVIFPANKPEPDEKSAPPVMEASVQPPRKRWPLVAGLTLIALFILAASNVGTYTFAYQKGRASKAVTKPSHAAPVSLSIPQGATIISQCAKNRGTQYVLPSNIPHGPVFNFYKGKVIGIEYMIGKDDLAAKKDFLSLPLYGVTYDHMNIGLLSTGHAGYPDPHYHVDLFTISPAESAAITCK